jgi:glutamate synthase domain-containing protein 1
MVWGRRGDFYYMASEESAIYEIEPALDEVHVSKGGEPVIVRLKEGE